MEMVEYLYAENLANALTHGVGALIFLVFAPLLIATAVATNSTRKIIGSVVFSFGLLAVYFSSTIFHAIYEKTAKQVLHHFDKLSIYLLISGTYTPFLLIYFRKKLGNFVLILVWSITVIGFVVELGYSNLPFFYTLLIYLGMGWIGVFLIRAAYMKIKQVKILLLLLIGGLLYTAGTYFIYYDESVKYYHAIWHIFVLGGSLSHYWAAYFAVKDDKVEA